MRRDNNKALYEKIMRNIAKEVKKALNESYRKPLKHKKLNEERMSNEELLKFGRTVYGICAGVFGKNNCKLITRILEDDGQIDIDLGRGIGAYKPNSDSFYGSPEEKEYNRRRVGRVSLSSGWLSIEGNVGNYETSGNIFKMINGLKKHLSDCFTLV
jgi:hypothetical protein